MLCDVKATLEEKLEAIRNRTPDQKMARVGVPVSIGGKIFEVKPMVRARARRFREKQLRAFAEIEAKQSVAAKGDRMTAEELIAVYSMADDAQLELVKIAIPELEGQEEWLDENATNEELAEALAIATAFLEAAENPNAKDPARK